MARPHRFHAPPAHLRRISHSGRDRGIALILVLWVLALLTVMAVSITATQRTQIALTDNLVANARFRAASDAAIAYMVLSFMMPAEDPLGTEADAETLASPWLPNGSAQRWDFLGQRLDISVTDEQSRINLNEAQPDLMAALIEVFQVAQEEADALADAIADFRDEDDLSLLNGAEDDDYEAAGLPLGAKDGPFVAVEELQQVLGMSRELYRRLAPELTVDTQGGQVNEEFASPSVIAALQGISMEDARVQVEERDNPVLQGAQGPRAVNRGGPVYRVRVEQQDPDSGPGSGVRVMEALVELTPGQAIPYLVRWRRFGLMQTAPPLDLADADADAL